MLFIKTTGIALAGMLLAVIGGTGPIGQARAANQQTEKNIRKVPVEHSERTSGAQMWKDYCASCHGVSGAGNGPAVGILKSPPADLSLMAKRNNGKFPAEHFAAVLRFGSGGHANMAPPICQSGGHCSIHWSPPIQKAWLTFGSRI